MEKKTIEVIVGQKVEGKVDPSKVAPKQDEKPEGDVEARWHTEYIECPYEGEIYAYWVSDVTYLYYTCKGCDRTFRK